MKIQYLGIFDDMFQYRVEVNGHWFDYRTGLGWSHQGKRPNDDEKYASIPSTENRKFNKVFNHRVLDDERKPIWRRLPSESDILECLESDMRCGQMSFRDFCDELGYNWDSISHLEIHRACEETARKLQGFKFPEREEDCG
jgi:hypothetical protein